MEMEAGRKAEIKVKGKRQKSGGNHFLINFFVISIFPFAFLSCSAVRGACKVGLARNPALFPF